MSGELEFKTELAEEFVKVYIKGEIDIYNAQKFKEKLCEIIETFKKDLKIDLTELNYLDSTGLGIFVSVLKKAKTNGKDIYLLNLKENIKKLFKITGLDKIFKIE